MNGPELIHELIKARNSHDFQEDWPNLKWNCIKCGRADDNFNEYAVDLLDVWTTSSAVPEDVDMLRCSGKSER